WRSLLTTERLELLVIVVVSIAGWWLFEFYNTPRFWNSDLKLWWHYHNLEPNLKLRRAGYDWAFATTPVKANGVIRAMIFIVSSFLVMPQLSSLRLPPEKRRHIIPTSHCQRFER